MDGRSHHHERDWVADSPPRRDSPLDGRRAARLLGMLLVVALFTGGCAGRPRPAGASSQPVAGGPAALAAGAPAAAVEMGLASWYGREHHGRRTASGERFDMEAFTAAHRSLPFGTWVRVTHLATGRSVAVRINDRGPWVAGRVIDLSRRAAEVLGILGDGVARVRVEVVRFP